MDVEVWSVIANLGTSIGVPGVLLIIVWLFARGDIMPKPTVDRVLDVYERRAEEMTNQILKRLDTSLKTHHDRTEERHTEIIGILRKRD